MPMFTVQGPRLIPAVPIFSTTTWNPADTGSTLVSGNVLLSNGNLTAADISPPFTSFDGIRSTNSHSSGKYYWEVTAGGPSLGPSEIGVSIGTWAENGPLLNTANGAILRIDGIYGFNSTNLTGMSPGFVLGDVVSVALDLDNMKIWFRINGAAWDGTDGGDPATNSGGISIAGFSLPAFAALYFSGVANQASGTARFSSASWSFSAPVGFGQF